MLQLQSFSLMWMVFLTAPLGLIGVVAALLMCQAPLGFVAILGVIALSGMIMRNSVILIDQVQTEMAAGRDAWNAVVDAADPSNAPGGADRGGHGARDGPAHPKRVLGSDGHRHHGWANHRHAADDLFRARALRRLVQR